MDKADKAKTIAKVPSPKVNNINKVNADETDLLLLQFINNNPDKDYDEIIDEYEKLIKNYT